MATITFNIEYFESYLPSPRHRKKLERHQKKSFSDEIREVTSQEAPFFLSVKKDYPFQYRYRGDEDIIEFRQFDNEFYTPVMWGRFVSLNDRINRIATFADISMDSWQGHITEEEAQEKVTQKAKEFLLIDNVLHELVSERSRDQIIKFQNDLKLNW